MPLVHGLAQDYVEADLSELVDDHHRSDERRS
jgi:hypothetical protein